MNHRRICVAGYMGAGKDEVSLRIAERLDLSYCNSDRAFEARWGPIESYLPKRERLFRENERKVFRGLLADEGIVMATGGGLFVNEYDGESNWRTALDSGVIIVGLYVDFDVAAVRIKNDTKRMKRPLFDENARARFDLRQPLYKERAHVMVDANRPIEDVVASAMEELERI